MTLDVGRRLTEIRKKTGLSQRELAKRAGVTNSTISMIEKNNVSPSIASLKKVLAGIPISLLEFFNVDETAAMDIPVVYKQEDFLDSTVGDIEWKLIGKNYPSRAMTILVERYPPGTDTGDDMYVHEGEESGFIIKGKIELTVDDDIYILEPGQGYYFNSMRRHRFRNPFAEECQLVSATTPAGL